MRLRSLLLAAALAATLTGCQRPPTAPPAANLPVLRGAQVEVLHLQPVPITLQAAGTVAPRRRSVLSARVTAHVTQVLVHEGERVRQGTLLASLDDRDARVALARAGAGLAAARASLAEARASAKVAERARAAAAAGLSLATASFQRQQALRGNRATTPQEFDEASSRLTAATAEEQRATAAIGAAAAREAQALAMIAEAEAQAAAARTTLEHCSVLAPYDAIVTARSVDPGALASPGTPLVTVEEERYWLEAAVPVSAMSAVRPGATVLVSIDALGVTTRAPVAEANPAASGTSHTFLARVSLDGVAGVRSGMYGTAAVEIGRRPGLLLPGAAVLSGGQLERVFVVDDTGIVRARLIRTAAAAPGLSEVLTGLSEGETVVTSGAAGAADPCRIEGAR